MAVTTTFIDGQNTGARLLGQTSFVPLTLNLTTGDVESAYLPADVLPTLRRFALNLFSVVPKTARPAAAIGLLSRLCAVSPADASTVTLSATVTSGVASLVASVEASPASLILTIPFAPAGGVMPGMPSSGSGPTPGTDSNLTPITFGESLTAGQPFCIVDGLAYLARANNAARMPCVGFVDSVTSETTGKGRVSGVLTSLTGLSPGKIYFLSTTGTVVTTPPSVTGQFVQGVGFALDETVLAVAPSTALSIR